MAEEEPISEEEIKTLQAELDALETKGGSGFNATQPKDNVYRFFKQVLDAKDSTKTANLTQAELGLMKLGTRHLKELALYAEAEDLGVVGEYFRDKAEIASSTSMGKKGFLLETLITQIKKESKVKPTDVKKSWFGKKKEEE